MKKLLALALAVLTMGVLFAGCGVSDSTATAKNTTADAETETEATPTVPETEQETEPQTEPATEPQTQKEPETTAVTYPVADAPFTPTYRMTENMLARSVYYAGDTSRLKAKLAQVYDASYTGETKVFFLGDSITEGSGSESGQNAFWRVTESWFNENGKSTVTCKNCGIGATDTYLAVHRVEKDVLSKDPDIIFIEFINDSDDEFYTACMESLIRKCLAAPTNPAVVLVEMTLKDGTNCQNAHAVAAKAYGVPVLSYRDAVMPEVAAGNFSFDDISRDGTHPNPTGHHWVAQIITHFMEEVSADTSAPVVTPFDPTTPSIAGDKYKNAGIYDKTSDGLVARPDGNFIRETTPKKFKNGWATTSCGTITFEATFQNFGLLYYKTTDGSTGKITIEIDGVKVGAIDGNFANGWGDYPAAAELYTSNRAKTHTVTITVREGTRTNFEILALLMS